MSIKHTIRDPKGNSRKDTIEVTLSPLTAIVKLCRECLGFDGEPRDCISKRCPVYPFRTGEAHSGRTVSEENRIASAKRLAKLREERLKGSSLTSTGEK